MLYLSGIDSILESVYSNYHLTSNFDESTIIVNPETKIFKDKLVIINSKSRLFDSNYLTYLTVLAKHNTLRIKCHLTKNEIHQLRVVRGIRFIYRRYREDKIALLNLRITLVQNQVIPIIATSAGSRSYRDINFLVDLNYYNSLNSNKIVDIYSLIKLSKLNGK